MQISAAIGQEAWFFMWSVLEGMGLVLLYDMFRIFRRLFRHGTVWIGIEDICYWMICFVAVFLLLYRKNDGMMRGFAFVGIMTGVGIYYFLFSSFVIKLFVTVLGGILKGLRFLLTPFWRFGKKILHFLKKQLKKVYKTIKIGLCKL